MKINKYIKGLIRQALNEDIGGGDVTTQSLIPPDAQAKAVVIAKQAGVIAGLDVAKAVFSGLDKNIRFKALVKDGDKVRAGKKIAQISGSARVILTAERTALNFLGHLSGIASLTRKFVDKVKPYKAKILDTRKTTPGLRALEKYAVRCGGGENHRLGLWAEVLVKDNHIAVRRAWLAERAGKKVSLEGIVNETRKKFSKGMLIEIEIRNLKELKDVLPAKPDIIMLDNMTIAEIRKAVRIKNYTLYANRSTLLEASGGITLNNVRQIAKAGVERISIGALTHSAAALDLSLSVE